MKRRKNKKCGSMKSMMFSQPHMETRPTVINLQSPPESQSDITHSEESQDSTQLQSNNRSAIPLFSFSQSITSLRNKTNLNDLYDLMKASHDLRLQKQLSKQRDKDIDETDLFFLNKT